MKGLRVDLVILNEDLRLSPDPARPDHRPDRRRPSRRSCWTSPAASSCAASSRFRRGSRAAADRRARRPRRRAGTLAEQVDRRAPRETPIAPLLEPHAPPPEPPRSHRRCRASATDFFNGLGGFTPDGREYVITLAARPDHAGAVGQRAGQSRSSARWSRESGGAYTWVDNAHEFRLTPWHNDPVSDTSGEAFYIRDEETGSSGRRRRCPRAATGPTSAATVSATACSSTTRTGIASRAVDLRRHWTRR